MNIHPFSAQFQTHEPDAINLLETVATIFCSLAIAVVPIFSYQDGFSYIPQLFAFGSMVFALFLFPSRGVRLHTAMSAYLLLVIYSGFSALEYPETYEGYQSYVKVGLLALAAHVIFRMPKQLVILMCIYSSTAIIAVIINWSELQYLRSVSDIDQSILKSDRFSGIFGNANTAGVYGMTVIFSAMLAFRNFRHPIRWLVSSLGVGSGICLVFYSGSRKAMLGIVALCLCMPWLFQKLAKSNTRFQIGKYLLSGGGVVCLGLLAILILPNNDRFFDMFSEGKYADQSSIIRAEMFFKSIELWREAPFWGQGFDGFTRVGGFGVYSHTTFGEILCNGGIVGFFLISIFYLLPMSNLIRLIYYHSPNETFIRWLLVFIALFTMFSFFGVYYASRDLIPMCAAIYGYLLYNEKIFPNQPTYNCAEDKSFPVKHARP